MRLKGKKPIFNYKDTWNLDTVLAPIIHAGLVKFKEVIENSEHPGFPGGLAEEAKPMDTDEYQEYYQEKWYGILDEMIYSFSKTESVPFPEDCVEHTYVKKGIYTEMHTNVLDDDAYEQYGLDVKTQNERIKRGQELFGKYYECLWW